MPKTKNDTAVPATPTGAVPEVAPRARPVADGESSGGWAHTVGDALASTVRAARDVLPASRLPVILAATALVVTGLIDAPAALGVGLAVEALRRWEPRRAG